jgi:hypothetical protein
MSTAEDHEMAQLAHCSRRGLGVESSEPSLVELARRDVHGAKEVSTAFHIDGWYVLPP